MHENFDAYKDQPDNHEYIYPQENEEKSTKKSTENFRIYYPARKVSDFLTMVSDFF